MEDIGENEEIERVTAACRAASNALPRGKCGVEAALLWLHAFPAACRLGLGDFTDSAPGLFRLFADAGLIPSCPSDGAMTGAIRLVASVSPLVVNRSPRTWTALMGSACDPESPVAATIRSAVTPAMLREPKLPVAMKRRVGSIRNERDRVAADLVAVRQELEQTQRRAAERLDELCAERDRLEADLSAAALRQRASDQDLGRSATTLAEVRGALTACRRELEQSERRRAEAAESARKHGDQAKAFAAARDQLRAELDRQTDRAAALEDELKALEAEVDKQSTRRRVLEAHLPIVTAERGKHAASLRIADDSLARARAELEGVRGSLVREAAAHADTRKLLQTAEMRRTTAIQEHQRVKKQLDAATDSAEAPIRALVEICKWLDIEPAMHLSLDGRLEVILTAIDLQQTTHRLFVHRVEANLASLHAKMMVGLYEAHFYRETNPDPSFASTLERARPELQKQAEALTRKTMAKLTEPEAE